jgi:hypothetical protein
VAALWPFAFFWKYVVPIHGKYTAIGNDFDHLYYRFKVVVIDGLSQGRMPLWSPSEAAGYPLYSNPFAAAFYPLNLLLVAIYRFTGGYGRLDHQIFTVLGVAIFSLGIHQWLRAMGLRPRAALFAACAISISFRICDTMRFPNAVHTAAWYPWILLALYRIFTARDRGSLLRGGTLLCTAAVCFITAGYPYYVYYSQFLLVPYLAALAAPWIRQRLFPRFREGQVGLAPWVATGAAGLVAGMVGLPYLMMISRLMKSTQDRGGGDFEYSTSHLFGPRDTLGSWIYPPSSESEGWYYFGLIGSLLIAIFVVQAIAQWKPERTYGAGFVTIILAWLAVATYITYGRDSALFGWFWRHWPSFSSLRVWGRMNIILLLPLAWLLAAAYSWFESWLQRPKRLVDRSDWALPLGICAGYLGALGGQFHLLRQKNFNSYWTVWFQNLWGLEPFFLYTGLLGFAVVMIAVMFSWRKGLSERQASIVTAAFLIATAADLYPIGSAIWVVDEPTRPRARIDIAGQYRESFRVCRKEERPGTVTLSPAFNTWMVQNWDYRRYVEFRRMSDPQGDAALELLGIKGCQKIFQTRAIQYPEIGKLLEDARGFGGSWELVDYNGDLLRLKAKMPRPGYLSFIDNWDPDWQARVDGEGRPIELLYGTFKSVALPAGEHEVEFVYHPRLFREGS